MTSAQFMDWLAYYSVDPDLGSRMDWLATWLGNVISKSFTGELACEDGSKAIEWGRGSDEDDMELLFKKLEAFAKQ